LTIKKYRMIDLIIWTSIALILDSILASLGLFGVFTYISIAMPILAAIYLRWNIYGLYINLVIAIAHFIIFLLLGNPLSIVFAHLLAIMTMSIAILLKQIKYFSNKEPSLFSVYVYFFSMYMTFLFSEWLLNTLFNQHVPLINHLLNHVTNFLLGLGLLTIMSFQKVILIDMHHYILKQKESK
jgi:hypothetical protein